MRAACLVLFVMLAGCAARSARCESGSWQIVNATTEVVAITALVGDGATMTLLAGGGPDTVTCVPRTMYGYRVEFVNVPAGVTVHPR